MIYLTLMMTIIFPGGVSYDIKVQQRPAPTMEMCEAFVKEQSAQVLVALDGTILRTYFECGKEI